MTKEKLFEKFGHVILDFYEYSSGTVVYKKSLLNGDVLIKNINYGSDITSMSFGRNSSRKLSEQEPCSFSIHYLPRSETKVTFYFNF